MKAAWYLAQADLFKGICSEAQIDTIANASFDLQCKSHYILYGPGHDVAESVYTIKTGEVQLYYIQDGKRIVFDTLGPGGVFGNFSLEVKNPTHYAEAVKGSRLCVIPRQDFEKIIAAYPAVLFRVLELLTTRIHDYEQKIKIDTGNAREKLLGELQRYTNKKNTVLSWVLPANNGVHITHEKLATITGLNRVTVTKTLQQLSKEGIIDINKDTGAIRIVA
jgi:CRP-like cAMP-binding protein